MGSDGLIEYFVRYNAEASKPLKFAEACELAQTMARHFGDGVHVYVRRARRASDGDGVHIRILTYRGNHRLIVDQTELMIAREAERKSGEYRARITETTEGTYRTGAL